MFCSEVFLGNNGRPCRHTHTIFCILLLEVQQKHLEKHHMLDGLEALGCLSLMEINGFLGWNSDWDCTLRAP